MMNLRQMEVFYAVMRSGSVSGAARMLNVTQPAVSAILKHCESQLKMKLFVPVAGRLQPTPEANAIFPDIAAVFGRLDAVKRLTKDLVGGRLGTLSVAAAFPIANGVLARAAATFLSDRPHLRIALQSLTSRQVLDRVINREVELGAAYEPIVSPEVQTEVLATASIACILRNDHPLAAQDSIRVRDLEPYPLLSYRLDSTLWLGIDRAFNQAGIVPNVVVRFGMSLTGMMLAHFGAGIALVEPFLLKDMDIPDMVARPLVPPIELKTVLIRHRSAPRSEVMEDFISHLKTIVADPAP
ncbi:LysR substrate-binding domain-containing protein [Aquabacter sp. CN5-332]|uniref:LysR substrate-binding domain-containing protein n=1 Tax=Aquabacter sp. CN5-332 TaxID=3156608 RepID=UPI0032B3D1C3